MNNTELKSFALELLDWHGGQSSGLYSVGSTMLAASSGKATIDNLGPSIKRAISELRNLKRNANYPECVSAHDEETCNALADRLQALL